jgi:hypothetical protein
MPITRPTITRSRVARVSGPSLKRSIIASCLAGPIMKGRSSSSTMLIPAGAGSIRKTPARPLENWNQVIRLRECTRWRGPGTRAPLCRAFASDGAVWPCHGSYLLLDFAEKVGLCLGAISYKACKGDELTGEREPAVFDAIAGRGIKAISLGHVSPHVAWVRLGRVLVTLSRAAILSRFQNPVTIIRQGFAVNTNRNGVLIG